MGEGSGGIIWYINLSSILNPMLWLFLRFRKQCLIAYLIEAGKAGKPSPFLEKLVEKGWKTIPKFMVFGWILIYCYPHNHEGTCYLGNLAG